MLRIRRLYVHSEFSGICPKLEPENVELSCYRTEDSLRVPCNGHLVQGMVVRVQCVPNYHAEVPVLYNEITCNSKGAWSSPLYKCVPGKHTIPSLFPFDSIFFFFCFEMKY